MADKGKPRGKSVAESGRAGRVQTCAKHVYPAIKRSLILRVCMCTCVRARPGA